MRQLSWLAGCLSLQAARLPRPALMARTWEKPDEKPLAASLCGKRKLEARIARLPLGREFEKVLKSSIPNSTYGDRSRVMRRSTVETSQGTATESTAVQSPIRSNMARRFSLRLSQLLSQFPDLSLGAPHTFRCVGRVRHCLVNCDAEARL